MLPMRLSVVAGTTACALLFASVNAVAQALPAAGDPSCAASAPLRPCAGRARARRCEEARLSGARRDHECLRELRLRQERLHDERIREQRLHDERVHEQRLRDERIRQRLHDEHVREDRLRAGRR